MFWSVFRIFFSQRFSTLCIMTYCYNATFHSPLDMEHIDLIIHSHKEYHCASIWLTQSGQLIVIHSLKPCRSSADHFSPIFTASAHPIKG